MRASPKGADMNIPGATARCACLILPRPSLLLGALALIGIAGAGTSACGNSFELVGTAPGSPNVLALVSLDPQPSSSSQPATTLDLSAPLNPAVTNLSTASSWTADFGLRVGVEVIVDFLEGDPDQPIVVGSVWNGADAAGDHFRLQWTAAPSIVPGSWSVTPDPQPGFPGALQMSFDVCATCDPSLAFTLSDVATGAPYSFVAAPEPSSLLLFGSGIIALIGISRRSFTVVGRPGPRGSRARAKWVA